MQEMDLSSTMGRTRRPPKAASRKSLDMSSQQRRHSVVDLDSRQQLELTLKSNHIMCLIVNTQVRATSEMPPPAPPPTVASLRRTVERASGCDERGCASVLACKRPVEASETQVSDGSEQQSAPAQRQPPC